MGPPQHPAEDLPKIVREQRNHIADLELKLRAYACLVSQQKERLLITLDTLDATQLGHTMEMTAERREKEALSKDVHRRSQLLRAMQLEYDDLRDAVQVLAEKVQVCTDYALWPQSGMRQTSFADPVHKRESTADGHDWNADLRASVVPMILSLTAARDEERRARETLEAESAARIATLEAQVARREAELEAATLEPGCPSCSSRRWKMRGVPSSSAVPDSVGTSARPLTREDALRVLGHSSFKNRQLEMEVKDLAAKLEEARAVQRAESIPRESSPRINHPQTTTTSPPRDEPASRPTDPPSRSPPNEEQIPRPHADPSSIPTDFIEPHRPEQPPSLPPSMGALDHQIDTLSRDLEALQSERRRIATVSAQHPRPHNDGSPSAFSGVLLIEAECIRLKQTETALRRELAAAAHRERDLRRDLEKLRATELVQGSSDPLGGAYDALSADERSMDLATPLQPTLALPPADQPLPPSRASSPVIPALESEMTTAALEGVQAQLDAAQRELSQQERELRALRSELAGLQHQIQSRDPRAGAASPA